MQRMHWQNIDQKFAYPGELGIIFKEDQSLIFKLWAPSADQVDLLIFDKFDSDQLIFRFSMIKGNLGVWQQVIKANSLPLTSLEGYYYQFQIQRGSQKFTILDPYAKSMAVWNYYKGDTTGKGAIINPKAYGPTLAYAQIPNYHHKLDAIIYELHVRDFSSDNTISDSLKAEFGTFAALIERLPYLKSLGVTHIQLLPIMSYYFINESDRQREAEYSSFCNHYSWGYDPFNYFTISGAYSEEPDVPGNRIEEFKQLIDAVHGQGMGIILDVVFNHTAALHIFEDIEPHYYYFEDIDGQAIETFGGGSFGTTHYMSRKLVIDALTYWTDEFKVDGFRFDMMGSLDAETVALAVEQALELNPNLLVIGEGWRTYQGDAYQKNIQAADQDWMIETRNVSVFSDDYRDEVKSGHISEGQARFITGGPRNLHHLFDNICGNPRNFVAGSPANIVQYFEAHDNLTLHDVIAIATQKDPRVYQKEILQRIRLAHVLLLTSQGIIFMHAGQEYGRTKQFLHPEYKEICNNPPYKSVPGYLENGEPMEYPYFIHDSYKSSDAINHFDWQKATNKEDYLAHFETVEYVKKLIQLRKSLPAFRMTTFAEIKQKIKLLTNTISEDLFIVYSIEVSEVKTIYIAINADNRPRKYQFDRNLEALGHLTFLVDQTQVELKGINQLSGVVLKDHQIIINPLTACVFSVEKNAIIY